MMKDLNLRENNFDILRLILAVFVGFYHWNILVAINSQNPIFHFGEMAVDSFFIISGFLIFWSFDSNQDKKIFYIKRFYRIFPIYFGLIVFQTLFFIGFSDGTFGDIFKYFITNLFFLNFLSPSIGDTLINLQVNTLNGSLWTLKNEVFFYAIVPIIFVLYKKFGLKFLYFLYFLSFTYIVTVNYLDLARLIVLFPSQLRLFIVGILLYVLFSKFSKNIIYLLAPIAVILIYLFNENEYFNSLFYPGLLGIIVFFVIYCIKQVNIKFDFSYSFYILHFPVIQLSLYFNINPSNPILSFLFLFSIILFLSFLSEKYIEKRFVNLGRSMIKRVKLSS